MSACCFGAKTGRTAAEENSRWKKLLDQIWHEYHTSLPGFIRRRVGVAYLAEDILQDVFIKAHSRLDTLTNVDLAQSWIYQIARNTIIEITGPVKAPNRFPIRWRNSMSGGDQYRQEQGCVAPALPPYLAYARSVERRP
jgi:hypothetical protein